MGDKNVGTLDATNEQAPGYVLLIECGLLTGLRHST